MNNLRDEANDISSDRKAVTLATIIGYLVLNSRTTSHWMFGKHIIELMVFMTMYTLKTRKSQQGNNSRLQEMCYVNNMARIIKYKQS